jgi:hypothetical protein
MAPESARFSRDCEADDKSYDALDWEEGNHQGKVMPESKWRKEG